MDFETLKNNLFWTYYHPGGWVSDNGEYTVSYYTFFALPHAIIEDGNVVDVPIRAYVGRVSLYGGELDEFIFPDEVYKIDGFNESEYIEEIKKQVLTPLREKHNPNDWERQG
jgi:hypothetical protein